LSTSTRHHFAWGPAPTSQRIAWPTHVGWSEVGWGWGVGGHKGRGRLDRGWVGVAAVAEQAFLTLCFFHSIVPRPFPPSSNPPPATPTHQGLQSTSRLGSAAGAAAQAAWRRASRPPPPGQRSACVLAGALPSRPLCAARFLPPAHLVCDEGEKGGIGVGGRPQAHAGRATGRAARRGGARREKRWAGRRLPSKCAPTRAPTSWPRRRSLAEALDLHPDLDRLEGGGDRESLTRAS